MDVEPERRKGPWKDEARDFKAYQDAIKEILGEQTPGSQWSVEIEVRRSGNPIHQYRVVLGPTS